MVLDNVDDVEARDPSSPLAAYLPQSHNGSILVTSRSRDAAAKLTGSYKNVKEAQAIDTGQALQLLQNKLEDGFSMDSAEDLLDALEYIPLAITQAAAYINRGANQGQKGLHFWREGDTLRGVNIWRGCISVKRERGPKYRRDRRVIYRSLGGVGAETGFQYITCNHYAPPLTRLSNAAFG
jgi:hypothetical protein